MSDPSASGDARGELRARLRAWRRDLSPADRHDSDRRVQHSVFELLARRPPSLVALSMPTDGEVDVATLAPALRSAGWTVALPVVSETPDGSPHLDFLVWEDDADLPANRFGIPEPVGGAPVPVSDLDVVVVPAVAVDRSGNRLGFGAGYYDRALAERRPSTLLVAAVHEAQLVDRVPADTHDVRVDVVVTTSDTIWVDGSAPVDESRS